MTSYLLHSLSCHLVIRYETVHVSGSIEMKIWDHIFHENVKCIAVGGYGCSGTMSACASQDYATSSGDGSMLSECLDKDGMFCGISFRSDAIAQAATLQESCSWLAGRTPFGTSASLHDRYEIVIGDLYCDCFIGWFSYCRHFYTFLFVFLPKRVHLHKPRLIFDMKQNYGVNRMQRSILSHPHGQWWEAVELWALDRICSQAEPPLILLLCPCT